MLYPKIRQRCLAAIVVCFILMLGTAGSMFLIYLFNESHLPLILRNNSGSPVNSAMASDTDEKNKPQREFHYQSIEQQTVLKKGSNSDTELELAHKKAQKQQYNDREDLVLDMEFDAGDYDYDNDIDDAVVDYRVNKALNPAELLTNSFQFNDRTDAFIAIKEPTLESYNMPDFRIFKLNLKNADNDGVIDTDRITDISDDIDSVSVELDAETAAQKEHLFSKDRIHSNFDTIYINKRTTQPNEWQDNSQKRYMNEIATVADNLDILYDNQSYMNNYEKNDDDDDDADTNDFKIDGSGSGAGAAKIYFNTLSNSDNDDVLEYENMDNVKVATTVDVIKILRNMENRINAHNDRAFTAVVNTAKGKVMSPPKIPNSSMLNGNGMQRNNQLKKPRKPHRRQRGSHNKHRQKLNPENISIQLKTNANASQMQQSKIFSQNISPTSVSTTLNETSVTAAALNTLATIAKASTAIPTHMEGSSTLVIEFDKLQTLTPTEGYRATGRGHDTTHNSIGKLRQQQKQPSQQKLFSINMVSADLPNAGDEDNFGNTHVHGNSAAWLETHTRRIIGNVRKSDERSRQLLLCEEAGGGVLCRMLFKGHLN